MFVPTEVKGENVSLVATNPRHFGFHHRKKINPDNVLEDFGSSLKEALAKVNNLQNKSDELTQKMIYDPGSVEIHDVMIAAEKARMAIQFTKSIRDTLVRSYRELTSIR